MPWGIAQGFFSEQLIWSLSIVAVAAFLQATVGFAGGMFGLPLLLWAGNDLMESQVLTVTAMLPQNLLGLWKLRRSIDLREVLWPATIRIATLPIGVAGLAVVLTWPTHSIQQLVGLLILFALAIQCLVGIQLQRPRRPLWMLTVFGGSGVLQGLSGMSGPPMVLWLHAQRTNADRTRAFLFAMYISNFLPQVSLLWYKFGNRVFAAMLVGVVALPIVLLSAMLGLRLGSWLGDRWLRPATFALLTWIGISSLCEPWLQAAFYPWIHSWLVN